MSELSSKLVVGLAVVVGGGMLLFPQAVVGLTRRIGRGHDARPGSLPAVSCRLAGLAIVLVVIAPFVEYGLRGAFPWPETGSSDWQRSLWTGQVLTALYGIVSVLLAVAPEKFSRILRWPDRLNIEVSDRQAFYRNIRAFGIAGVVAAAAVVASW